MKALGFAVAIALVCLAGSAQAEPVNLITNGGFDTDLSGWDYTEKVGSTAGCYSYDATGDGHDGAGVAIMYKSQGYSFDSTTY